MKELVKGSATLPVSAAKGKGTAEIKSTWDCSTYVGIEVMDSVVVPITSLRFKPLSGTATIMSWRIACHEAHSFGIIKKNSAHLKRYLTKQSIKEYTQQTTSKLKAHFLRL